MTQHEHAGNEFNETHPYVFVLRNAKQLPLVVGVCPAGTDWDERQREMANKVGWWDEVEDYVLYSFSTEKRCWEYSIHIAEEFAPIYQPRISDNEAPPVGQLDAMMDPSPNPPKMFDPRKND